MHRRTHGSALSGAPSPLSRYHFLRLTGAGAASFMVVPSRVLAARAPVPPGEKLNLAFFGLGSRGEANLNGLTSQNVVALCDADQAQAAAALFKNHAAANALVNPPARTGWGV